MNGVPNRPGRRPDLLNAAATSTSGLAPTAACSDGCCTDASPPVTVTTPDEARRATLTRRVRLLVAATITYNLIEAAVALTAGTIASSAALIAFGLDSVIEVASATAVAWQFSGRDPAARERAALRVIALSFLALASYVTVESVRALLGAAEAAPSTVGIGLAALSLVVMPFLSAVQRRAGRELGSRSAVADSKQTLLCTYLSAVLLAGLLLNALFGWSWADPMPRRSSPRSRSRRAATPGPANTAASGATHCRGSAVACARARPRHRHRSPAAVPAPA